MTYFIKKNKMIDMAFLSVALIIFTVIQWQFGLLLFHTLIELSTIFIGIMMLIIALNTKQFTRNDYLLFLGIGFFFVALLDIFHLLTVPGMAFFPNISIQITLHFWIYTRLFEAVILLLSLYFLKNKLNENIVFLLGIVVVFIICWISFTYEQPILITEDGLTAFKNNFEYLIIAIMLFTIFVYYQKKSLFPKDVFNYLIFAIIFGVISEYAFTFYLDFKSTAFTIGHLLKLISFGLIYQAIVHTTLREPFKQLSRASSSYNVIPHPAVIINKEGVIQYINDSAKEFVNDKSVLGKPIHPLFHPQEIEEKDCLLCQAYINKTVVKGDVLQFSKIDKYYQVYSETILEQLSNNSVVQLFIDVTENKKAYSSLQNITQQLIYTQKNAHIGSWKLDFDTNNLWCSDEVYDIFEIDKNKFRATYQAFVDAIHPEDKVLVEQAYNGSIEHKSKYDIEHRLLMTDGRIKYVHEQCITIYDDAGKPLQSLGSVQDITQRHEMTEALNRAEKMDALGKLTGGVAHDFNNLLGVILGYSEILAKELKDNAELTQYVDFISKAGYRGANLTRKLLSFSKNKSSEVACININQLITSNEEIIKKTLAGQINFETTLLTNLWNVQININDFDDVILNMCINSFHAMPKGGSLKITTKNETLTHDKAALLNTATGDYVVLTVEDTGSGMSEDIKNKIFDPFFTTKKDKGTGLGLSQAYGFIKSSGGVIQVHSEIGVGSRFIMYFPRFISDNKNQAIVNEDSVEQELTGNETILIVDDEKPLEELAQHLLQAKGYTVYVAENALQALLMLEDFSNEIDLVLSDIIMPEMNGFELAKEISKIYPNINILLASGFQDDNQSNDYKGTIIAKPYDAFTLLSNVRQCLDSIKKPKNNSLLEPTKLPQLQWHDEMSLDDGGSLDQAHKNLIMFINKCHRMDRYKLLDDIFNKHVKELIQHVTEHFENEERQMLACNYPFYKNHCDVHHLMKKQLNSISNSQNTQEIYQWIITDFSEWVHDHILGLDRAFITFSRQQSNHSYDKK